MEANIKETYIETHFQVKRNHTLHDIINMCISPIEKLLDGIKQQPRCMIKLVYQHPTLVVDSCPHHEAHLV